MRKAVTFPMPKNTAGPSLHQPFDTLKQFVRGQVPCPTGTLPKHATAEGEDAKKDTRMLALSEEEADDLVETLKGLQSYLNSGSYDKKELVRIQVALIQVLSRIFSWLGGRATVATDEIIKKYVLVSAAEYVLHLQGIHLDLHHILTTLAFLHFPN